MNFLKSKSRYQLAVFAIIITLFNSCAKKGCTDCNAINYDKSATHNDESCEYWHQDKIGTYSVNDSLYNESEANWTFRAYKIVITHDHCNSDQLSNPDELVISNYANLTETGDNDVKSTIRLDNGKWIIDPQTSQGINIFYSKGFLQNDSIELNFSFQDEFGNAFSGVCHGKK